jgi:nitrate/nitrite transport system ATP-binding protein
MSHRAASETEFLEVSAVSKSYGRGTAARHVLWNVSLTVERGSFVAIIGSTGCGKSTLLSILAGLTPPDTGEVRFEGEIVRGIQPATGIVFQNYSLLPWLSALENVRLAVAAAFPGWSSTEQRERAYDALVRVGLANAIERRPRQLSGGMRQRVAIARAFAIEPEILFLDEPFGALDALTRVSLQRELADLCAAADRTVTTLMVTNSVEEALLLADRIVPMTRGPRAMLGTPVPVSIPRPRSAEQLLHGEEVVRARSRVIESLTASADRARAMGLSGPSRT